MGRSDKKESVRARICRALDLYPDALGGEACVEIRGRGYVAVRGCREILGYTSERISLSLLRGALSVEGEDLVCVSYLSGAVGIEGRIGCVRFEEGV